MIKWIGTWAGIIGAVFVAGNFGYQSIGYASFLIGSIACFYSAFKILDKADMTLWGFFTLVNTWGILNYV